MFASTLLPLLLPVSCLSEDPTLVSTQYGPIQGTLHGSVVSFQSVPFAAPPVGSLRWAFPVAPDSWSDTLVCDTDPPQCVQPSNLVDPTVSENCLFLNVFRPVSCDESNPCASLTWIHGGSFFSGYAGGEQFNGTYMANLTSTIVISINYRLGVLGFLWNDELNLFGNYGYMDQVFALEWVANNIASFGGDPNQIYIYGESAGATSVSLHLMNTSMTFIRGAIMESIPAGVPLRNNASWGDMPIQFENVLGCSETKFPDASDRLACLRNVSSIDEILAAQDEAIAVSTARYPWLFWPDFMPWTPSVLSGDGLINDQPVFAFQKGEFSAIPVISGTNQNESDIIWDPIPTECWEVSVELDDLFGPEKGDDIRAMYNISKGKEDCRQQSKPFETDSIFRCPARNMSLNIARKANNDYNTYWYHFNHVPSFGTNPHCEQPTGGVCHSDEIAFVFGSTLAHNFTSDELQLSKMMQLYWASFAQSSGDVNKISRESNNELYVQWAPFQVDARATMLLNTDMLQVDTPFPHDEKYCNFWDDVIGYDWLNRQ